MSIINRKKQHIEICLKEKVEEKSYFDDIVLVYNALPDLDFDEIDTKVEFLGKELNLPLIISSITGGTEEAKEINKVLAKVAENKKIGFAVGSQRAMIENKELSETFFVRDVAPSTLVLGNIGIPNLNELSSEEIKNAVKEIGANGLFIHLNPAQEIAQKEGDINFKNSAELLKKLISELDFPVVAKEVGQGISKEVSETLKDCGVKAIDVAGVGGTNWIKVETFRGGSIPESLLNFGIPTTRIFRTDLGDDDGNLEWENGRIDGNTDPTGDDDIDILIKSDGQLLVEYRN